MERTLKIFLSCALGAGIGALTALQLNQYFWWIGMLFGGFIGYLSYEIKQVLAAIPLAWQKASRWRPDKKMWKLRARAIARILSLSITAGIGVSLFCWFVYLIIVLTPLPPTTSLEQVLKTSVRAFLLCFPIFFCFFSF
ncbi:hypothetical protein KJ750_01765, partial [Patescibacteria group bacterium]|nr:hypothetical protein [Patescibacteria group bacterium]